MLKKHIMMAYEFHLKNNLQIEGIDQFGMFERNNLLFEEIGELVEACNLKESCEIKAEAMDVYYIILGTFVALGIDDVNTSDIKFYRTKLSKDDLIISASQMAQATRRRFDDIGYIKEIESLSVKIINILYSVFEEQSEFNKLYKEHHRRVMKKERRKIGDTYVISDFKK